MTYADSTIWWIIIAMGVGTYGLRFGFLALLGNRTLPPWVLRHLRYTAVAVMPAIIAPLVLWPAATGGQPDPARLAAAAVTLAVGVWTKNLIYAVLAGAATLYTALYLLT